MIEPDSEAVVFQRLSRTLRVFHSEIQSALPRLKADAIPDLSEIFEGLLAPLDDAARMTEAAWRPPFDVGAEWTPLRRAELGRAATELPTELVELALQLNATLRTVIVEVGFTIMVTSGTLDGATQRTLSCLLMTAENARRSLDELAIRLSH